MHPLEAKAGLSAGGSWRRMKVLVFLLTSHAEGLLTCGGLSTQ